MFWGQKRWQNGSKLYLDEQKDGNSKIRARKKYRKKMS